MLQKPKLFCRALCLHGSCHEESVAADKQERSRCSAHSPEEAGFCKVCPSAGCGIWGSPAAST